MKLKLICLASLLVLLLTACSESVLEPNLVVEQYIDALADGDADTMATLSCAEWEDDARMSADSFAAVETTVEDLNCETSSSTEDTAAVVCQGTFTVSYEGEDRSIPLSEQTFLLTRQGDWLVCGVE